MGWDTPPLHHFFFAIVQMIMAVFGPRWLPYYSTGQRTSPPTLCWSKLKVNTPSGFFLAHDPKGVLCVKIPPWALGVGDLHGFLLFSGRICCCCSSQPKNLRFMVTCFVYTILCHVSSTPFTIWKICDVYCGINPNTLNPKP